MKQELALDYSCVLEDLYHEIDDCNLRWVDTASLRRFITKCAIKTTDALLIAIVRRLDLDADARLSLSEFKDGLMPLENFSRGSLAEFKQQFKPIREP